MHLEILSPKQEELLSLVALFKNEFYLAGGTAIALHIGHRSSIDFDLFKEKKLIRNKIFEKVEQYNLKYITSLSEYNQVDLIVEGVKITFLQYPYPVARKNQLNDIIKMPDLLTLGGMKAFAIGRRSKWKDYVDLYFLIKDYFSVQELSRTANQLFGNQFVEKQFIAQLGYFKDINFDEKVNFLIEHPPKEDEIMNYLKEISISGLRK